MRKSLKMSVLATLLTVSALTTSCYGPFQLTRNLWKWNGEIENQWGREGMYLVLSIIPVYGVCVLGDTLIFNSIVFWGGENPIKASAMADSNPDLDSVAATYGLNASVNSLPVKMVR